MGLKCWNIVASSILAIGIRSQISFCVLLSVHLATNDLKKRYFFFAAYEVKLSNCSSLDLWFLITLPFHVSTLSQCCTETKTFSAYTYAHTHTHSHSVPKIQTLCLGQICCWYRKVTFFFLSPKGYDSTDVCLCCWRWSNGPNAYRCRSKFRYTGK